tara:strand:+ start:2371 stop:2550 length:180 start_codon:yes stop_codon:yes gene_type:complete
MELPQELAQDLLDYLADKPFKEVYLLVPRLMALGNTAAEQVDTSMGTDVVCEPVTQDTV